MCSIILSTNIQTLLPQVILTTLGVVVSCHHNGSESVQISTDDNMLAIFAFAGGGVPGSKNFCMLPLHIYVALCHSYVLLVSL